MKTVAVCLVVLMVAACSAPDHTTPPESTSASVSPSASADAPNSADTAASASTPPTADTAATLTNAHASDWQLLQSTSPMDGRKFTAHKVYNPDDSVGIEVDFQCLADTHSLRIEVDSIVGDPNNPSKSSALQKNEDTIKEALFNSNEPITNLAGRVRFGSLPPQPLSDLLSISGHFSNVAVADLRPTGSPPLSSNQAASALMAMMLNVTPTSQTIYNAYMRISGNVPKGQVPSGFNPVAGLRELFPIALEVVNGAGTYDVSVPYANEIATVLSECGGDAPILPGVESARGAEAASSEEAVSSAGATSSTKAISSEEALSKAGTASSTEVASNSANAQVMPALQPASFDCKNAASPVEIAICTHPQLSDLDGRLALAYKQLLPNDPLARPEQRDWLQNRNKCGNDVSCLISSYQDRLKEIQAIQSESRQLHANSPQ